MDPIDPAASLAIMELVHEYVDVFKVGKVNHAKSIEQKVNWTEFLNLAVFTLNKNGNEYYIKDDLYAYANEDTLKMLLPKHRNRLHSLIKSTWNDPFEGLFDDKKTVGLNKVLDYCNASSKHKQRVAYNEVLANHR